MPAPLPTDSERLITGTLAWRRLNTATRDEVHAFAVAHEPVEPSEVEGAPLSPGAAAFFESAFEESAAPLHAPFVDPTRLQHVVSSPPQVAQRGTSFTYGLAHSMPIRNERAVEFRLSPPEPVERHYFDGATGPALRHEVTFKDGQTIAIYEQTSTPARIRPGKVPSVRETAQALAHMPASARALLETVSLQRNPPVMSQTGWLVTGGPNVHVHPSQTFSMRHLINALVHESGHTLYQALTHDQLGDLLQWGPDPAKEGRRLARELKDMMKRAAYADGRSISRYASSNVDHDLTEWFAETFLAVVNTEGTSAEAAMRATIPHSYRLVQSLAHAWSESGKTYAERR